MWNRSIPACTGEPSPPEGPFWVVGVYPRVYGGTRCCIMWRGLTIGLSPRVRGNRRAGHKLDELSRSIPACTGEPTPEAISVQCTTVYPRVYGGTIRGIKLRRGYGGLSPRVRGNREASHQPRARVRSIPACTGEPFFPTSRSLTGRVYPRVYGGTCCSHWTP